jgi:Ser/Thr protein kinase RdoA (MazF antagonist)
MEPSTSTRRSSETTNKALILAQAGERYGFSPSQAVPLSGGHFSMIYEFPRDGETFVLRITPPNAEIDASAIHAVLNWLSYLAAHDASVPYPIVSLGGSLTESVVLDHEPYILAVFKKANGTLAEDLFPECWSDDLSVALGHAVGKMHAISRNYHPDDKSLQRPAWNEISNCFNPSAKLDDHYGLVAQKQQEIQSIVQSLSRDDDSYGLIHTDLHFANFIVDVSTHGVTIIDFDDCAYGWYVMDIAMLLLDSTVLYTGLDGETHARDFLKGFLLGYLQEYRLNLYWIRKLPDFMKLLEIGLYTILYHNTILKITESWVGRFMAGS